MLGRKFHGLIKMESKIMDIYKPKNYWFLCLAASYLLWYFPIYPS